MERPISDLIERRGADHLVRADGALMAADKKPAAAVILEKQEVTRELVDAAEAGVNAALEHDWLELPLDVRQRMASAAAAAAREVQPFDPDQVQAAAEAAARGVLEAPGLTDDERDRINRIIRDHSRAGRPI